MAVALLCKLDLCSSSVEFFLKCPLCKRISESDNRFVWCSFAVPKAYHIERWARYSKKFSYCKILFVARKSILLQYTRYVENKYLI